MPSVRARSYDLYLVYSKPYGGLESRRLLEHFTAFSPLDSDIQEDSTGPLSRWGPRGPVPSLAEKSHWRFSIDFYGLEAIREDEGKTREMLYWAVETPLASWKVKNAVQLDGDQVVFQLGESQICILDVNTRRIALVTRGFAPVVAKTRVSRSTAPTGELKAAARAGKS